MKLRLGYRWPVTSMTRNYRRKMLATRQFRLLPKPQGSDKVIRIPLMSAQSVE